jgi:serine/threonine-protein kinase
MNTERNLLFGILAFQLNFIDRHALLAAFDRWTTDKSKPLGEVLVQLDELDSQQRQLLDALVVEHLKMNHDDCQHSLAAASSLGVVADDLRRLDDADINSCLPMIASPPRDDPVPCAPTLLHSSIDAKASRYRIVRPHARGGLGEVFVAIDEELHREVALKEIQGRHAHDAERRARFVIEAEITGGLEHPGIVPVYGLGSYADGRPFYAMRFIKGDSLKEAIDRFHAVDEPGAEHSQAGNRRQAEHLQRRRQSTASLEFRKLLGRLIDVCNAIGYAHSRGVLHRDLKPGNVMLGKYGETLVVDWGLAKVVGRVEAGTLADECTLQPTSASGSSPTQMGSAVGTPQYMSPEQAEGRLDLLGPATDVYSLGATLYCLLAGRAPFAADQPALVLQQVVHGTFPAPRSVNIETPMPLQAVCLKAMALKPSQRYSSARELADDLEHWLADEAVSAWHEPLLERARRWVKRHQALVWSAAAAVLVAAIGLTTGVVLLSRANDRHRRAKEHALAQEKAAVAAREEADSQRIEAEKQAELADANFRLAYQAVNDYFTRVSESKLFGRPGLQPLRKELLADALRFYKGFVESRGGDPALRIELARTYARMSQINRQLAAPQEAFDAAAAAVRLFDEALRQRPGDAEIISSRNLSLCSLGQAHQALGRRRESGELLVQSVEQQRSLAERHDDSLAIGGDLAHCLLALGDWRLDNGKMEGALADYREALGLTRRRLSADPENIFYRWDTAGVWLRLGGLNVAAGKPIDAIRAFEEAAIEMELLAKAVPENVDIRDDLAEAYNMIGYYQQRELGRAEEGIAALSKALALRDQLVRENPKVGQFRDRLIAVIVNLANIQTKTSRFLEARPLLQRAIDLDREAGRSPNATTLYHLGELERKSGDDARALETLADARTALEAELGSNADLPHARYTLSRVLNEAGMACAALDRNDEALKHYRTAIEELRGLAMRDDDAALFQRHLVIYHVNLAGAMRLTGQTSQAESAIEEARRFWPSEPAELVKLARELLRWIPPVVDRRPVSDAHRQAEFRKYANYAMVVIRHAVTEGFNDADQLESDTEFEPLDERDDFRSLIYQLRQTR